MTGGWRQRKHEEKNNGSYYLRLLFVFCFPAGAQQPKKVPRIGYLSFRASLGPGEKAFLEGLQDLGYVEGKTIVIEWRRTTGKPELLADLAAELVRLKVDVLVAAPTPAVQAAKNATSTIPIVMAFAADPVGTGFVASLARPGGNITGLSGIMPELAGKRLDCLGNFSQSSPAWLSWHTEEIQLTACL